MGLSEYKKFNLTIYSTVFAAWKIQKKDC
jgi:hypothetical protein